MPQEGSQEPCSEAIQSLRSKLSKFETEEGRRKGLSYQVREGDVFIVTPPKCGTTWIQQIVHQLRSKGSMDFGEISEVIPFIEIAHDVGQNLDDPQRFSPRAFKTHCWHEHCPKGNKSKHILVYRDPFDVVVSFFKFFEGWFFAEGEITLEEFTREFWLARGRPNSDMQNASYFHHLLSWWEHRNSDDVLFLIYEDIKEDLGGTIDRIAQFLEIPCSVPVKGIVEKHSTFEFMSANKQYFDERLAKKRNEACGLPADAGSETGKVRKGQSGTGKSQLSPELKADIEKKWMEVIGQETGLKSYEELRSYLKRERALEDDSKTLSMAVSVTSEGSETPKIALDVASLLKKRKREASGE